MAFVARISALAALARVAVKGDKCSTAAALGREALRETPRDLAPFAGPQEFSANVQGCLPRDWVKLCNIPVSTPEFLYVTILDALVQDP